MLLADTAMTPNTDAASSTIKSTSTSTQSTLLSLPLVSYHEQQKRGRKRRLDTTNTGLTTVAELMQGYGTHYVDLWCGSPIPQRQTVIVDTGSGATAFPCVGCQPDHCGVPNYHIDTLFDPGNSSSFTALTCSECRQTSCSNDQCRLSMSYMEGSSWSAYQARDLCYIGGLHGAPLLISSTSSISSSISSSSSSAASYNSPKVVDAMDPYHANDYAFPLIFGCQTMLTGLFKTQLADGILGMNQDGLAFWAQMASAEAKANAELQRSPTTATAVSLFERKFSLCFSRSPIATRNGTDSGAMTLGGYDTRLHQTPMVFTPITSRSGSYSVTIRQIYVRQGGGESAAYDPKATVRSLMKNGTTMSAIVDSGTTDTYFSQRLNNNFITAWRDFVNENYSDQAMAMTKADLYGKPTLLVQLVGDIALNTKIVTAAAAPAAPSNHTMNAIIGLAGKLDPDHPYDVILAIPASHLYEYDPRNDQYRARVYFDAGSNVIGANAIMGHDVFFDNDQHQLGWSESHCDYPTLVEPFLNASIPNNNNNNNNKPSTGEQTLWPTIQQKANAMGCGSTFCQLGLAAGILVFAILVVVACVLIQRRIRSQVQYSRTNTNELELPVVGSIDPSLSSSSQSIEDEPCPENGDNTDQPANDGIFVIDDDDDVYHHSTNGVMS